MPHDGDAKRSQRNSIEADVRAIATAIAEAGASQRTRVYRMSWWTDKLLDAAMSNDAFRTQLFRLVDVFPATTGAGDVARHVEEYFDGIDVPTALDLGLEAADHLPWGDNLEAAVTRRQIRRMARQFIAGESPSEALPSLRELWRAGEAATVDLLGEKTVTIAEADRYASRVHELIDVLAADAAQWPDDPHLERDPWGDVARVNVSVKATALAPLLHPLTRDAGLRQAYERLHAICEHARDVGAAVTVDMEHYDVKDITLELVRMLGEAFPDGPQLGCVIQAYLRDAIDDLRGVATWSRDALRVPLNVRLVKGAYWDHETIVASANGWPSPMFASKGATDANYERCVAELITRAGSVRPAFATHNLRSLAVAIASAREAGLHESAYEMQLLYGMAEPVHAALRRFGLRVRTYAPVGELLAGIAYLVRRLLENTANTSFLRHRFAEGRALEELIAPPDATEPADARDISNEPLREFRRREAREHFGAAVLAASIPQPHPAATTADVDRAVEAALLAQPAWGARRASERADVMRHAAHLMRARRDDLAAIEVFEAGKPWSQADADVCEAIDFLTFYAAEAERLGAGAAVRSVPGEANRYVYRPRGIAAVIAPWNFPLAIPCGMVSAALVCGNAVLFKPAEQTPHVAQRLVEILHQAGVPPDMLAFLPGAGEVVGAHLVDHPAVSVIAFTGSKDVGLHIIQRASVVHPGQRHTKRVIAEMGGKNAIVVDSDADLDVAVPAIVDSAFGYAGQKCSAASRLIAVGEVFDMVVARVVDAARIVPVGDPADPGTVVGPVIDEEAHRRIRSYQQVASTEGDVRLMREDVPAAGCFVGPTVVVVDDPNARVATEEIFGPVLVCLRANDFEHALELANAPPYALTAGIFSRLPSHIERATQQLRAGNIYVNRGITGAIVGRQPFGGWGLSGVGSKAGGPDYLLQFCDPVVVTENTVRQGFAPTD